ncbi:MAG: type II toxin-antitoxin system RelE/ParE family toxin [Lachnospiraceae bacterium]|nr:type II toxin-antitoxin system RelE/ParE family toxin [Lachnospiraceae bacterium]
MAFEIEFYSSKDGREPVAEFLDSLDSKMSAKLVGLMEILEEKGTELRMPYSEHLEDGIFELRSKEHKLAKERRADWLSRHKEG